jgi:hypothetical protein
VKSQLLESEDRLLELASVTDDELDPLLTSDELELPDD